MAELGAVVGPTAWRLLVGLQRGREQSAVVLGKPLADSWSMVLAREGRNRAQAGGTSAATRRRKATGGRDEVGLSGGRGPLHSVGEPPSGKADSRSSDSGPGTPTR